MKIRIIKLFLRMAPSAGFLSAIADRFGLWHYHVAWGNWDNFVNYTQKLIPVAPEWMIQPLAILATFLEGIFAIFLLLGFKTESTAKWSGCLLLIFALAMTGSTGIKAAFDASVFAASASAFALSMIRDKYLELDCLLKRPRQLTK